MCVYACVCVRVCVHFSSSQAGVSYLLPNLLYLGGMTKVSDKGKKKKAKDAQGNEKRRDMIKQKQMKLKDGYDVGEESHDQSTNYIAHLLFTSCY